MADEILSRDQNFVTVLAGITDDSDQDITMLRVDPITKRLLVKGEISGGAVTSISVVGEPPLTGAVTLSEGSNINLTQTDQDIEIAAVPSGSDTQVQFNDGGVFGGDAGFTYDKTTNTASLGGLNLNTPLTIENGGTSTNTFDMAGIVYYDGAQLTNNGGILALGSDVLGIRYDTEYVTSNFTLFQAGNDTGALFTGIPMGAYWSNLNDGFGWLEFNFDGTAGGGNLLTLRANLNSQTITAETIGATNIGVTNLIADNLTLNTPLPVSSGGTGASSFVDNRILTGNGTSAIVDEANLTFDGTTLTHAGGVMSLSHATANRIQFGTTGFAAPGASSAGMKIKLFGANGVMAASDYAIGINGGQMWFNSDAGFGWFEDSSNARMTLATGGGLTINAGGLGITNGVITQSTATGANNFTGSISTSAITYTAAIRQMSVAAGVTIMEYNFLPTTAINANRLFRIGRETNTGTGVLQTEWYTGLGTSLGSLFLEHKRGIISHLAASQTETANWSGVHRLVQFAAPGGVTVTPIGTTGATTYSYRVTAITGTGETTVSTAGTTTTGNAVLSSTNYNRITWTRVASCMSYKIYGRTSGTELLLATVNGGELLTVSGTINYDSASTFTFEDNGSLTPSGAQPTANTTGVYKVQNSSNVDCIVLRAAGEAVFNEQGADQDFRVEGDTDANLFFVDASTDRIGIGTNAPGTKFTVSGVSSIKAGTSTAFANQGGVIFDHFTDAGNVGTGEDDLYSDTTAASTLGSNGDKLSAHYAGTFVSSATATRRLRTYFGGTLIYDSTALSLSTSADWDMTVEIIRESSTVVRCSVKVNTTTASSAPYTQYTRITGLTLSSTNILKITGEAAGVGAADNDIVAKFGHVEWKSAI